MCERADKIRKAFIAIGQASIKLGMREFGVSTDDIKEAISDEEISLMEIFGWFREGFMKGWYDVR